MTVYLLTLDDMAVLRFKSEAECEQEMLASQTRDREWNARIEAIPPKERKPWERKRTGWWSMEDGTLRDSSGYGNNGAFNNASSSSIGIGKNGNGAYLVGNTNGGINLGNSSTLKPAQFTIMMWVNAPSG